MLINLINYTKSNEIISNQLNDNKYSKFTDS